MSGNEQMVTEPLALSARSVSRCFGECGAPGCRNKLNEQVVLFEWLGVLEG